MKIFILIAILATPTIVYAKTQAGTYKVEFQPRNISGIPIGCALVYNAIALDTAYMNGQAVMLDGTFGYIAGTKEHPEKKVTLKVGLKDYLGDTFGEIKMPHFAYLQSAHGTTANSKFVAKEGEQGYKMFIIHENEETSALLADIMEGLPITLGYNRREGGMDVLVDLDLSVSGVDAQLKSLHSTLAVDKFTSCMKKLDK